MKTYFIPADDHRNRTSKTALYMHIFNAQNVVFSMKGKDIPKFEKFSNSNTNVFKLTRTVLTPVYYICNNDQSQIVFRCMKIFFCLITGVQTLINKDSHMKHVCRRCLTAFSSLDLFRNSIERCIKQN